MKTSMVLGLGALIVGAVAVAATPLQDAKAKSRGDEKAGQGMAADPMMEAYMKHAAPSPQHAEMAKAVGTWKVKAKSWMDPSQPPMESEGKSKLEMAMDGRYLIEHYDGEMPGMGPFKGMGILAYNNISGEYQHVWMDSVGTGLFVSTGKAGANGELELKGMMDDPMGGGKVPCRMISKNVGPNERTFEMYCTQDGAETKSMELHYTRGEGKAR